MRLSLVHGMALLACLLGTAPVAAQPAAKNTAQPAAINTAQTSGHNPQPAKPQAPLYITAQTDIIIPFTVRATDPQGRPPALVRIYVSLDQGQGWQLYQEVKPAEKSFRFRARRDAEFWFATQTVNADGSGDRADNRAVQMRLIVDTTKPQLQVLPKVESSGKVSVHWSAADPFLAANSVRLEWQPVGGDGWQHLVADKPTATRGQYSATSNFLPPTGTAQLIIRGEAADTAGNKTIVSRQFALQADEEGQAALVPAAPGSGALAQRWTPEQNDPFARQPQRNNDPAEIRAQPHTALARVGSQNTLPPPREGGNEVVDPPQLVRNPYSPTAGTPARPANTGELLPPPRETEPPSDETPTRPFESQQDLPSFNGPENERPAPHNPVPEAIRAEPLDNTPPPRRVENIPPPSGSRPRMTGNKRFSLDYDIESISPEGIADVELWGTADQGRSWMKWGSDPDRVSPFEVEVSNEAVYGFRIVIVGRNGLASNTPQAGDTADIWVGVDLARPRARLTGATLAGGEQAGKLEIRWDAHDDHFGARPITIGVSDRAAGPFTPIAAGLPNTGSYYWEFDPRIRRQLFIRLEAQDEAGNLSVDQLTDPISIEGLAPRGRIRDLAPQAAPQNGPPPQAFRSPLFR